MFNGNHWIRQLKAFIVLNKIYVYLGQSKSTDGGTVISYKKLQETFSVYSLQEKRMVYFSMLFDHTSR